MAQNPGTNKQVPEHAIYDFFNKQVYLGNQYLYTANTAITGTSENAIYLLSNPPVSGNAFPNSYKSLFVNLRKFTCATSSQSAVIRFYVSPTATPGSPLTPLNARPLSLNTSIAALSSGPTASANGSLIGAVATSAFVSNSDNNLLIIDPGQSLLITCQATANSTLVSEIGWYEI